MTKDKQKTKLYKWEDKFIGPADQKKISIEHARSVVNYVWEQESLKFPPVVELLPTKTFLRSGDGNRGIIRLLPEVPTWVVLHEVAHSMNSTIDDIGDGHGPNYLWLYMKLIATYINLPLPVLMYTAKASGLEFNIHASPRCGF